MQYLFLGYVRERYVFKEKNTDYINMIVNQVLKNFAQSDILYCTVHI